MIRKARIFFLNLTRIYGYTTSAIKFNAVFNLDTFYICENNRSTSCVPTFYKKTPQIQRKRSFVPATVLEHPCLIDGTLRAPLPN